MQNYGKAIRIVRCLRDLSQNELAHRARGHPSYISMLESGNRTPSICMLNRLAQALDVPVHLLALLAAPGKEIAPEIERALKESLFRLVVPL